MFLLEKRYLVSERILRRGFCVGRWTEIENRQYPLASIRRNAHDNIARVLLASALVQKDTRVPRCFQTLPLRGFRVLEELKQDPSGGWTLEEVLSSADREIPEGVWIEQPNNGIHAMPNALQCHIALDEAAHFQPARKKNEDGVLWHEIEYEVSLVLDDDLIKFEFIMPKCGNFDDIDAGSYEENSFGQGYADEDVFRQVGEYNCSGIFDLITPC